MKNIDFINFTRNAFDKAFSLNRYNTIMERFCTTDITTDEEFHKNFIYFYRVRRSKEWCDEFFKIMQELRHSNDLSISDVLKRVCCIEGGGIELSFSSKLLHTINPDMPIWDSVVCTRLNLPKVPLRGSCESRISAAVECYQELLQTFEKLKAEKNTKQQIALFDKALPMYSQFSTTKKIDFFLWQSKVLLP